jgi:hypothetical protein
MTSTGDGWMCEAYGPEAAEAGALCFVAEPGQRLCADPDECARTVAAERRRVFRRIQELSTTDGDVGEAAGYLESVFTNPDQLLGGPGTPERDDE